MVHSWVISILQLLSTSEPNNSGAIACERIIQSLYVPY